MGLYHWSRRQILSKVWLVRGLAIVLLVVVVGIICQKIVWPLAKGSYGLARSLWVSLPQTNGRTNFLILGIGGGIHEGPDLTDSMMVLSVRNADSSAVLISVPRDLWVDSMKAKINTAYHYGEEKQVGGGFILAKSAVFEMLNLPIHKVVLIDFSGFVDAIDALGGIDVNVGESFVDNDFPIVGKENDPCESCRYETIKFEAGLQHMDGNTALKFVRSRHAEGDEGTDFARSKRQEEVITATKKKISFKNIQKLYAILKQKVKTDILIDEYFALAKMSTKIYKNPIKSVNIAEPVVYNPPISAIYDYQWVLISKNIPEFIIDVLGK